MKNKIILYIASTLDGYIALKDNSIKWLDKYNNSGEDFGYKKFLNSIDAVIVGNTTQKQFPQKYEGKPTFVFSRVKKETDENITYVKGSVKDFFNNHKDLGNIWLVGGYDLIDQFLKEDLIDEFIIFIMPELLGDGISLFNKENKNLKLKLISTKTHGDCVELHYKRG